MRGGGTSAGRSRQRTAVCDNSSCRRRRLHGSCCRIGAGGGGLAPRAGAGGDEGRGTPVRRHRQQGVGRRAWPLSSAPRSPTTTMRRWPAMRPSSWSGASAVLAIPDFRSGSASTRAMSSPTWSPANFPRSTRSAAPPSILPRGWRPRPRRTGSTCRRPARSSRMDMSDFESLGRKVLRGFNEPLPVYRVVGASDLSSWRVRRARSVSRFVDRTTERALLARAAERSSASRQTVLLIGDAGIGKSRLAHEFAQELRADGWRLIDAECSPNLQGVPFSALKRTILSIFEVAARDSDSLVDIRKELPAIHQRARSISIWIFRSRIIAGSELEPYARARAISDASCAIVQSLAFQQRTVLLIEDLHWIDRASDAVVAAIASLQSPNLIVFLTSRPNGMPEWIARCHAEVIAMRPLDDNSGLAMLADMLGPSATNTDLKNRIISHTANVPLFLEEVCRGLKDSGTLRGQWGDLALVRPDRRARHPHQHSGGDCGAARSCLKAGALGSPNSGGAGAALKRDDAAERRRAARRHSPGLPRSARPSRDPRQDR